MIAIYARVSTEEQAKNGFSLLDQVRECRSKAATTEVKEYVDEGISGEFLDRPALDRLRADVRNGLIHQVICLDPDRLSRKLMNQLILSDEIEAKAELLFVSGAYARTPEGQLFYQMRGAISQFEKAKINERMSRGRREKARQGRVLRDFRIYGYDFDPTNDRFVVNDREAAIVRLVFDLFTHPQGRVRGINGIARYLTDLGVPTKRGAPVFHRQVVRQMLMNRAYIGEFYQNRWNTEGMLGNRYRAASERIRQKERPQEEWIRLPIPALVERATFDFAAALLEQARRRYAGQPATSYLLSGLLRCATCGNTLTGVRRKNWGRVRTYYTDVKKTVGSKHPGCGLYLATDDLECAVWKAVLQWVGEPDLGRFDFLDEDISMPTATTEMQRQVEVQLTRLAETSSRLLDWLGDSAIDPKDVRDKLMAISEKRKRLEAQLQALARADETATTSYGSASSTRERLQCLWAHLQDVERAEAGAGATAAVKRALLRTVIREIHVHADTEAIDIVTF